MMTFFLSMLEWLQVPDTNIGGSLIQPLLNVGAVGAILWWFMTRLERFMRDNTRSQDRLTRSILLLNVSLPSATPRIKEQARHIMHELERDTGESAEDFEHLP